MCGILGTINNKISIENTRTLLEHRGPDAQTAYRNNNVDLHHFRLSILDISGGKQPMQRNDLVTIFNGEIYNHLEVRKKYNLKCTSNSDTETLLAAFEKMGPDCLNAFDGMFALAIYDSRNNKIFLARDRAGKKPLYVFNDGKHFGFASELNALKQVQKLELNEKSLMQYLTTGAMVQSVTPYKYVEELEAGHYAWIDTNSLNTQVHKWWGIDDFYYEKKVDDYNASYTKITQNLREGIKRRIDSSDLEVGAFLSGGIDSSLVVALATEFKPNLKTFTVSMPGAYDEAPLAKLVSEKYNTEHTEIKIDFKDLKNDFESIIMNYGEPFFDSSAIPSYYVSKAAKEHITVILNGDGADELFGGYRRYVLANKWDYYNKGKLLTSMATTSKKIIRPSHEKKSIYNYLYRMLDIASTGRDNIYWSTTLDIFSGIDDLYLGVPPEQEFTKSQAKVHSKLPGLQKQMLFDFNILLKTILLKKMDIATMAHSLEGRSPFLSKEILELAPTIADSLKIRGTGTKFILREIAKEYLPKELINQPKRGFEIPLKNWVNNELYEIIHDSLLSSNALYKTFLNTNTVQKILNRKLNISEEKRAKFIYALTVFELWHNNYKCESSL